MQTALKREAFIPINRRDLIDLCLADNHLAPDDARQFCEFCEILAAYFHFKFHAVLESIKENYAPFNPSIDVQSREAYDAEQLTTMRDQCLHDFRHLLEKSNYIELSRRTLNRALEERSLVSLQTDVNFDDFQKLLCYYRGDIDQQIDAKGFLWWRKKQVVDIFERVVLLIQFQNESFYLKKGIDVSKLNFTPGKMYLYFYKDVPKYDLELLFPNVKTWMTWKDRLMLFIPAIGAGIGIIIKVLPQIGLLLLALLVSLKIDPSKLPALLRDFASSHQSNAVTDSLAILVTVLSVLMVLGGFVAKQYTTYKSKKIKFQKHVTDTLFFRSMANHAAVFQLLVDVAEEEECKEVILAYYHLLISPRPLSAEDLDQAVEGWMHQRLNVNVDFDIQDALDKLHRLQEATTDGTVQGLVMSDRPSPPDSQKMSEPTRYHAASIPDAKCIIDRLWDNAFLYSC